MLWSEEVRLRMIIDELEKMLNNENSSIRIQLYREKLDSLLLYGFDPAINLKKECVICGDTGKYHLHFHHIDPSLKQYDIHKMLKPKTITIDSIVGELRKCVVLCANCHLDTHRKISVIFNMWVEEVSS